MLGNQFHEAAKVAGQHPLTDPATCEEYLTVARSLALKTIPGVLRAFFGTGMGISARSRILFQPLGQT